MATSGSYSVRAMWDRPTYLKFNWNRTNVSIKDNYSEIKWELQWVSEYSLPIISVASTEWNVNVAGVKYSGKFNNTTTGKETKTIASGTEKVYHQTDGSMAFFYSFSHNVGALYGTKSDSGTELLDPIPRPATLLTVPEFNDEDNPTITYSNPAGEAVTTLQAAISLTDGVYEIPYRDIPKTGGSYTFALTSAERATLRRAIGSVDYINAKFYIKSTISGVNFESYKEAICRLVNYYPVLNPTVKATDARTKELTGDASGNTIIKYVSDVTFNVGATARKEAAIEYRTITCGSTRLDDYTSDTGTIENVDSNTFYFGAMDTRGKYTADFVVFSEDNKKFIPYVKLTNSIKSTVLDANGVLTVNIEGKYYNGSFGAKNNSLDIDYSIVDENGNYVTNPNGSGWDRKTNIVPNTRSNSGYSYNLVVSGLDYEKDYTLQLYVIDEVGNAQAVATVVAPVPVFDWGKNDFKHNTDVVIEHNKAIIATRANKETFRVIEPCNGAGHTVINWDSYNEGKSDTEIYGNNVHLNAKDKVTINGRQYGANKVLWRGESHMNANQVIELSESISAQPNGVVLVFSYYEPSAAYARDVGWSTHFVPKYLPLVSDASIDRQSGGQCFLMGLNAGFSLIGSKYLFIENDRIGGHSGNTLRGTNSGITFKNDEFVLRYVIGV